MGSVDDQKLIVLRAALFDAAGADVDCLAPFSAFSALKLSEEETVVQCGCRHRALRAAINTVEKDTASATRTARRARAPRTTAAAATATTAATFARGTTSAASAAPQQ